MAHQAHNIPWSLLASNLGLIFTDRLRPGEPANLYPRFKPSQAGELNHFAEAFARNIRDHAKSERGKFPVNNEPPPARDDIVLSDDVVTRTSPTMYHVRKLHQNEPNNRRMEDTFRKGAHCGHVVDDPSCRCPITATERKMEAFLIPHVQNGCYEFFKVNGKAFFQMEIVKALILYGEMDTLLRLSSSPDLDWEKWWDMRPCYDTDADAGWDQLAILALRSYICLNIIQCFPELWDDESGKTPESDYRHLRCYQFTARPCTSSGRTSSIAIRPHRQFFGVGFDDSTTRLYGKLPDGILTWEAILDHEKTAGARYQPSAEDVAEVRNILCCSKGLPAELALHILRDAEYIATRRLPINHDPFHEGNRAELKRYLTYCWQLIVRSEVLGAALGMRIDWAKLVGQAIIALFSSEDSSTLKLRRWYEYVDHRELRFI